MVQNLRGKMNEQRPPTGFAAGTLVHTKEGLKRIEEIQVGDWVLSQPESSGKRAYKQVVRTTCTEDTPVWTLRYFPRAEMDKTEAEERMMPDGDVCRLVATPGTGFEAGKTLATASGANARDGFSFRTSTANETKLSWEMVIAH